MATYDPSNPTGVHIPSGALSFSIRPLEPMSDSSIMITFKRIMRSKYYFHRLNEEDFY